MTQFDPKQNKWLLLSDNIKLGSQTVNIVICQLDKYFEQAKLKAYVTSIYRSPEDQLRIIINYAKKNNLQVQFSEKDYDTMQSNGLYVWQETWSLLLNKGIIVNPPLSAKVLFDYVRDGKNKKGEIIPPSPHFFGNCFDIGGGANGIQDELNVINYAIKTDKDLLIKDFLIEKNNNCIHINVKRS